MDLAAATLRGAEIPAVRELREASLGQPDAYPFVLSAPAIEKLRFVHQTIAAVTP